MCPCLDAVQRRRNLPPARPAVQAVPLAAYAREAARANALHLAKQLQLPRSPRAVAGEANAGAHAQRDAAVRQAAGELAAAYTEDVIPLITLQYRMQSALWGGTGPHAVRMLRAPVLALRGSQAPRARCQGRALRAGPQPAAS